MSKTRGALLACLLIPVHVSLASDPFETFNSRFSGTSNTVHGASFGAGSYVAVGDGGRILSSTDTITWIPRMSGTTNRLNGVRYGGSGFVAVGELGTILNSVDGVSWASVSSPVTNALFSVSCLSNRYVIVGAAGRVLTSTNALGWTSVNSHILYDLNAVENNSAQFVAAGNSGTILTSPDGLAWTPRFTGISDRLTALAPMYKEYGGGRFVAVAESGTVLTTTDATTWTLQNSGTTSNLYAVASDHSGRIWAAGEGGVLITSEGGTNWTTQSSGSSTDLYGMLYANGSPLVVGSAGTMVSGIPWLSRNSGTSQGLSGVCFGNGKFVAAGGQGTILTSSNGTDWSQSVSGFTGDLSGVCRGANGFIAVAGGGNILSSPDGFHWNTQVLGATNTYLSVAYGNGAYVVLGYYYGGNFGINRLFFALRSIDGTNWTGPYSLAIADGRIITFGSNIFLAAGWNGSLARSPDGIAWTSLNSGVPYDALDAAAFGNGTFVAMGYQMTTSTNGVDWTPRNLIGGDYKAMTYGPLGFVASGVGTQGTITSYGNIMSTSPDGINWSFRGIDGDIEGPQIASIAFGSGTYVAVGGAGLIRQTTLDGVRGQPFLRGSLGASGFALSAIAQPGYTYTIQSCGAFGSAWTDVGAFTSTQAETIILDSTATNRSESFYRIRSP